MAALLLMTPAFASAQTPATRDQCVTCHLELEEERLRAPAEQFPDDVHGAQGFDCLSCHGRVGEGDGGLDAAAGFLAAPRPRDIPGLCGRCHSDAAYMRSFDPALRVDQVAEYLTSGHGQALMASGDSDVATCVSCHPAHRIRTPDDPESSVYPLNVAELCGSCHQDSVRMAPHGLPTDQLREYRTSVHGRMMFEDQDLTAPTCNDCHGNHGAAPPGVPSVRNVCGECHAMMADFFAASGHVDLFVEEDLPGCATCHDHHAVEETTDDLLIDRSETTCARCHSSDDPARDEFRVMKRLIDSLQAETAESRRVLLEAENLGMEVDQALFELDEVSNALVKARTAIHSFDAGPVRQEIDVGLAATAAAMDRGEEALYEHWFRRAGLALSAFIILGLIVGLTLKIRRIEDRSEAVVDGVETFFRQTVMGEGGAVGEREIRLAAAALLAEMVHTTAGLPQGERLQLEEPICRSLRLDADAAETLVRLTREEGGRGGGLHEFSRLIAETLSPDQKRLLLDTIWGLLLSTGGFAEHEPRFMAEAVEKLGMQDHWRSRAERVPMRPWMRTVLGAMSRHRHGGEDAGALRMAAAALLPELVHGPGEGHGEAGIDFPSLTPAIAILSTREERVGLADALMSLILADEALAPREPELMDDVMELLDLEPAWLGKGSLPGSAPPPPSGEA